ncbi:MAG: hypothetical protein E7624_07835 [Ruminococcaceae bacterium]|nr:hypothetical protein [Oscillospiraceae bacterium]
MTSNPMITKDDLRKIHLYCYEDVQEFLAIHRSLEEELQKADEEMDMDLVEESLAYIEQVMNNDTVLEEGTLDAKYQEVLAKASQKQDVQPTRIVKRSKKRAVRKFFFILAAAITVLFTTLTIAARICGYKNAWEFVYQKAIELRCFDTEDSFEEEGITLIGNGEIETFSSFEEFLEKENLDVLYPQPLPEGLKIDTITKYCFEDGSCNYTIRFNNNQIFMTLKNYSSVDLNSLDYAESYIYQEKTFYIKQEPLGFYQAICHYENFEYTINCADYDTLIAIIHSMKGPKA